MKRNIYPIKGNEFSIEKVEEELAVLSRHLDNLDLYIMCGSLPYIDKGLWMENGYGN